MKKTHQILLGMALSLGLANAHPAVDLAYTSKPWLKTPAAPIVVSEAGIQLQNNPAFVYSSKPWQTISEQVQVAVLANGHQQWTQPEIFLTLTSTPERYYSSKPWLKR